MSLIEAQYNDFFVTKQGYLVALIQASGINLDLLTVTEQEDVFDEFNAFLMSTLGENSGEIQQYLDITMPVDFSEYVLFWQHRYLQVQQEEPENKTKLSLIASYVDTFSTIASTMVVDIFGTGTMAATLLLLFLIVVFVIFTFKICVYHVDLIILEVFIVFAAITIATENYHFSEVWWREFLSQIVSIVSQVLLMAALVQLLANFNSWYDFMLIIGCGVLIIHGPNVLRSMWYSSGGAKGGISLSKSATRVSMMRLLK